MANCSHAHAVAHWFTIILTHRRATSRPPSALPCNFAIRCHSCHHRHSRRHYHTDLSIPYHYSLPCHQILASSAITSSPTMTCHLLPLLPFQSITVIPSTAVAISPATAITAMLKFKGVQGSECRTRGWVGRSAIGQKKDFWNPL